GGRRKSMGRARRNMYKAPGGEGVHVAFKEDAQEAVDDEDRFRGMPVLMCGCASRPGSQEGTVDRDRACSVWTVEEERDGALRAIVHLFRRLSADDHRDSVHHVLQFFSASSDCMTIPCLDCGEMLQKSVPAGRPLTLFR